MNASDGGATQSGRCDSPQGRDERVLSPAARRALAEAEPRREQLEPEAPREITAAGDPTRSVMATGKSRASRATFEASAKGSLRPSVAPQQRRHGIIITGAADRDRSKRSITSSASGCSRRTLVSTMVPARP